MDAILYNKLIHKKDHSRVLANVSGFLRVPWFKLTPYQTRRYCIILRSTPTYNGEVQSFCIVWFWAISVRNEVLCIKHQRRR